MLQRKFNNSNYIPEMYHNSMENVHQYGFGYTYMYFNGDYSVYHPGNGYCVESILKCNYSLIFKC